MKKQIDVNKDFYNEELIPVEEISYEAENLDSPATPGLSGGHG